MNQEPNFDGFDQRTIDTILEYGHQVVLVYPVEGGDDHVPFAYTVGRSLRDEPELLITGSLPPAIAGKILNDAVRLHDEGKFVLQDGFEYPAGTLLRGPYGARAVEVDPRASEMFQAINMMGEDRVRALQIVWPCPLGGYPGEQRYSLPRDSQPIHRREPAH